MNQQESFYKCDRCKENPAIRLVAKMLDEESVELDICAKCAVFGFGLILKTLSKHERERWIEQFLEGIIKP